MSCGEPSSRCIRAIAEDIAESTINPRSQDAPERLHELRLRLADVLHAASRAVRLFELSMDGKGNIASEIAAIDAVVFTRRRESMTRRHPERIIWDRYSKPAPIHKPQPSRIEITVSHSMCCDLWDHGCATWFECKDIGYRKSVSDHPNKGEPLSDFAARMAKFDGLRLPENCDFTFRADDEFPPVTEMECVL